MKKHAYKIYRTTNWTIHNRALIKRGNISIWFDSQTQWYAHPQENIDEIKSILIQLFKAVL